MSLESKIQRDAKILVENTLGIKSNKLQIVGSSGFNDLVFWLRGGRPFLIEVKRPGQTLRKLQQHVHNDLISLGYLVETHNDKFDILAAIIKELDTEGVPERGRAILARAEGCCSFPRSRDG